MDVAQISPTGAPLTIEDEQLYYRRSTIRMELADPSVPFVAKPTKVKTRKGKEYYVMRVTIPKDIVERLRIEAQDFLLFRVQHAAWYHMLNWTEMPEVWQRLPAELQVQVQGLNLPYPRGPVAITADSMPMLTGVQTVTSTGLA